MCHSLDVARALGHKAVFIFGHTEYYPRFGFREASVFGVQTADGANFPAFMGLELVPGALEGITGRLCLPEVYSTLDQESVAALKAELGMPPAP